MGKQVALKKQKTTAIANKKVDKFCHYFFERGNNLKKSVNFKKMNYYN